MRANDEPVRPIAASCPMDSRLPQPPSGDPAGSPDGQASSHASSNRKAKKAAKKRNRRRQSSSIGEESAFGMDACGSSPGRYSADGGMERGLRLPPIRTLSGESSQTFGRHQGLGTGCGEEGTPMLRRDSGVVPSPRSPALPQRIEEEPFPSFDQYWTGEVKPTQKYPRTDVKWGRTEREKV
ncbi:unnamed protein product [Ostreobium quekettii]|uniref:Uncharacterized protein n=1 Tax=Ostreobium quekettii TaxID=121088 RepID=A0A8S1IQE4_9CHLO|nr:unnamed protein product [Ostreobium quekettii]|eukprot:evm.model.scf_707.5 EVM.evm.TU.scf_707.5   scf_707:28957-30253(-)